MVRAVASFTVLPIGYAVDVGPGEFIGRSDQAALCLADPRVSEAHAMVSLRGRSLMLLGLRGRFKVRDEVVVECELTPGLVVELAPMLHLRCEAVHLPDALLGVRVGTLPTMVLAGTTSVYGGASPKILKGFHPDSDAVFWTTGDRWHVTISGEHQPATTDLSLDLAGCAVHIERVPLAELAHARTRQVLRSPMRFVVSEHNVQIHRTGEPVLVIGGVPGRILSCVVAADSPVHWREVTELVWPDDLSLESALRKRFDVGLGRLRERLAPIFGDGEEVLSMDGSGVLTLKLAAEDRLERI